MQQKRNQQMHVQQALLADNLSRRAEAEPVQLVHLVSAVSPSSLRLSNLQLPRDPLASGRCPGFPQDLLKRYRVLHQLLGNPALRCPLPGEPA